MGINKSALKFLINKFFLISLIFLLIQQLIVASSTYWIGGLAKQVSSNESFTLYLALFILSLSIVYVPSSLAAIFLEKSKFVALERYIDKFRVNFWNRSTIRTNKELKNHYLPFISSEGFLVFDESTRFIFDWISVILNVSLSVIALAIVLDVSIIWSYLLGLLLVAGVIFSFRKKLHSKGSETQIARTSLQRFLSLAWDNFLLGNKYNQTLYQNELNSRYYLASKTATSNQYWNNFASVIGMLLMMTPVLIWTSFLFYENRYRPSTLAVLVATLPRQVLVLQHAYVVIFYTTSWSSLSSRLTGLWQASEPPEIEKEAPKQPVTSTKLSHLVKRKHDFKIDIVLSWRVRG